MYDVFVSYSRADGDIVYPVVEFLQKHGIRVWIDREGVYSGDAFTGVIVNAIRDSSVFLFFSSKSSNSSKWVEKECILADKFSKRIIPLRLDDSPYSDVLTFHLCGISHLECRTSSQREYAQTRLLTEFGRKREEVVKKDPWLKRHWLPSTFLLLLLIVPFPAVKYIHHQKQHKGDPLLAFKNIPEWSFKTTVNDVAFEMRFVSGRSYIMGAQNSDENAANYDKYAEIYEFPPHEVTVKSFYIASTETTQELWRAVMGTEPSGEEGWSDRTGKGDDYPAYNVNWVEVHDFIRRLNEMSGKQFRLPTEEEWELAAYGGSKDGYEFSGSNSFTQVAVYDASDPSDLGSMKNSSGGDDLLVTPLRHMCTVKSKSPNGLMIYDMSGNLWEMCESPFSMYGEQESLDEIMEYVCRGGAWGSSPERCRKTARKGRTIDHRSPYLGFRLAMSFEENSI